MELNKKHSPPFNKLFYWETLLGNNRYSIVLNRNQLAWIIPSEPTKIKMDKWVVYERYQHEKYFFGHGWKIVKLQSGKLDI